MIIFISPICHEDLFKEKNRSTPAGKMVSSPQAIDTSPHHYMLVVAVSHELIGGVLYEVMIY